MPHGTYLWRPGDNTHARRSRAMAGTSCQRNHRGESGRRGPTNPARAGMRLVDEPFLTRIQGYNGGSPSSVAVTSAHRERHAAPAQSATIAAGSGSGLWLFRSESFYARVHETLGNEPRGLATPPPRITRATKPARFIKRSQIVEKQRNAIRQFCNRT